VHGVLEALAQDKALGLGKIAQPLRVAVSGGTVSPPIDITLALLGRARTLARLDRVLSA
jgi:glutamyl-tRNA synthetase